MASAMNTARRFPFPISAPADTLNPGAWFLSVLTTVRRELSRNAIHNLKPFMRNLLGKLHREIANCE